MPRYQLHNSGTFFSYTEIIYSYYSRLVHYEYTIIFALRPIITEIAIFVPEISYYFLTEYLVTINAFAIIIFYMYKARRRR